MFKNYFSVLIAAAIVLSGMAAAVQAEVLFSDNFNGAAYNTTHYGLNDDTGGVRHSAGGTAYSWGYAVNTDAGQIHVGDSARGGYVMSIDRKTSATNVTGTAIIQHNFNDAAITNAGGFTVRFDIDPVSMGSTVASPSTQNYGGNIFIGAASGTGNAATTSGNTNLYDPQVDVAFNLTGDGIFNAFKKGPVLITASEKFDTAVNAAGGVWTPTYPANYVKWYTCELRVATSSFAGGVGTAIASFWIGPQGTPSDQLVQWKVGNQTYPSTSMPGMSDGKSFQFTWDDGSNFIGFGMSSTSGPNYQLTGFDNIVIVTGYQGVPEPSTLALLVCGLIGLSAYAWRKRK